jgi:heme-degrading monooxygenase HmoA
MIKRVVKMTFLTEEIDTFLTIFNQTKRFIRASEGCTHLELWRSTTEPNIMFTLSYWESEIFLEKYRQSDLFRRTWAKTKVLFADKPSAWTVEVIA